MRGFPWWHPFSWPQLGSSGAYTCRISEGAKISKDKNLWTESHHSQGQGGRAEWQISAQPLLLISLVHGTQMILRDGPVKETRRDKKKRQVKVTAEKLWILLQNRLKQLSQLPEHPIDQLPVVLMQESHSCQRAPPWCMSDSFYLFGPTHSRHYHHFLLIGLDAKLRVIMKSEKATLKRKKETNLKFGIC